MIMARGDGDLMNSKEVKGVWKGHFQSSMYK